GLETPARFWSAPALWRSFLRAEFIPKRQRAAALQDAGALDSTIGRGYPRRRVLPVACGLSSRCGLETPARFWSAPALWRSFLRGRFIPKRQRAAALQDAGALDSTIGRGYPRRRVLPVACGL